MANFYGTARSNYVRVKDEAAFRKWADDLLCPAVEVIEGTGEEEGLLGLAEAEGDGTAPSARVAVGDDGPYDIDIDFFSEVAEHLADNEVFVWIEAGAEKLRYISGNAVAVHSDGRTVTLGLSEIYDRARAEFGEDAHMTAAEY